MIGTVVVVAEAVGTVYLDKAATLLDKIHQEVEQRQLQEFLNNGEILTITKSLDPANSSRGRIWSPPRLVRQPARLLVSGRHQPFRRQPLSRPAARD